MTCNKIRSIVAVAVATVCCTGLAAPAAHAFDPSAEAANYLKILERPREYLTPGYQFLLGAATLNGVTSFAQLLATDPSRSPLTLCATKLNACAGDVRLYGWGSATGERVRLVHFTARTGALLSGHVWSYDPPGSKVRAHSKPGVVITPGSVQVVDEHYWWAAQTLARHGYEVLTYDIQSQGRSDVLGTDPSTFRNALPQSMPSFVENTEDALHFLQSTPSAPYAPVTTTSRCATDPGPAQSAAQQRSRVKAGRADAFNPLHASLDADRIALAAHSYGTLGPATIGQCEPSVRATVAWDNLRAGPGVQEGIKVPAPRVPALGFAQDYGLPATPFTSDPDPEAKNTAFKRYVASGVDVLQLNLRGATHTDYTYLPLPAFGASLRGLDLVSWYTVAWLDRYLRRDASALPRILTDRFRDDRPGAAVDTRGDGNLFSFYYRSRMAITVRTRVKRAHRRSKVVARAVRCDNLRAGCGELVPRAQDGHAGEWSYLKEIGVNANP